MADARFEDATEAPLHLVARDAEDLSVLSARRGLRFFFVFFFIFK